MKIPRKRIALILCNYLVIGLITCVLGAEGSSPKGLAQCEQSFRVLSRSAFAETDLYRFVSDWSVFRRANRTVPASTIKPIRPEEFNAAYIHVRKSVPAGVNPKSFLHYFPAPSFTKPKRTHFPSIAELKEWEKMPPFQTWRELGHEEVARSYDVPVSLAVMSEKSNSVTGPTLYRNNVFWCGFFASQLFKKFPSSVEKSEETWTAFLNSVPWLRWDEQNHEYLLQLDHSAETILSSLGENETTLTVYRGTSALEVEFTKLIRAVRLGKAAGFDLEGLTRALEKQGAPAAARTAWDRVLMRIRENRQSADLTKDLVSFYRSFILSDLSGRAVFVTPSKQGAVFFKDMKSTPGGAEGAIASYKVKIGDLKKMAADHRIYVGLENEGLLDRKYVEIAFPFEDSIERILDAFDESAY